VPAGVFTSSRCCDSTRAFTTFFAITDGHLDGLARLDVEAAEEVEAADHVVYAGRDVDLALGQDGVAGAVALEITGLARLVVEGGARLALARALVGDGVRGLGAHARIRLRDVVVLDFEELRHEPDGFEVQLRFPAAADAGMGSPVQAGFAGGDQAPFDGVTERLAAG